MSTEKDVVKYEVVDGIAWVSIIDQRKETVCLQQLIEE